MALDIFYGKLHQYSSCSCSVHTVLNYSTVEKGRDSCFMQHLSQKTRNSIMGAVCRGVFFVVAFGEFSASL